MDAVGQMGHIIQRIAQATAAQQGFGFASWWFCQHS